MKDSFGRDVVLLICVALCSTWARAIDGFNHQQATQQDTPRSAVPPQQKSTQTPTVQSTGVDNAKIVPEVEGLLDLTGLHTGKSSDDDDHHKNVIPKPSCKAAKADDDRIVEAGIGNDIAIKVMSKT